MATDDTKPGQEQGEQLRRELAEHLGMNVEQVGHEWGSRGGRHVTLLGATVEQHERAEAYLMQRSAVWWLHVNGVAERVDKGHPMLLDDRTGSAHGWCPKCAARGRTTRLRRTEIDKGHEMRITHRCPVNTCENARHARLTIVPKVPPPKIPPRCYTGPSNESVVLRRAERAIKKQLGAALDMKVGSAARQWCESFAAGVEAMTVDSAGEWAELFGVDRVGGETHEALRERILAKWNAAKYVPSRISHITTEVKLGPYLPPDELGIRWAREMPKDFDDVPDEWQARPAALFGQFAEVTDEEGEELRRCADEALINVAHIVAFITEHLPRIRAEAQGDEWQPFDGMRVVTRCTPPRLRTLKPRADGCWEALNDAGTNVAGWRGQSADGLRAYYRPAPEQPEVAKIPDGAVVRMTGTSVDPETGERVPGDVEEMTLGTGGYRETSKRWVTPTAEEEASETAKASSDPWATYGAPWRSTDGQKLSGVRVVRLSDGWKARIETLIANGITYYRAQYGEDGSDDSACDWHELAMFQRTHRPLKPLRVEVGQRWIHYAEDSRREFTVERLDATFAHFHGHRHCEPKAAMLDADFWEWTP